MKSSLGEILKQNNYIELEVSKCTNQLNILYIEDDAQVREETKDIFESFFANVDTAVDGLDGYKKYVQYYQTHLNYYDLVITDLVMPKKNGEELIEEIIKINSEQAIIVISAHHEYERLIKLIRHGVSNFVMKPMQLDQLIGMLYKTCKNVINQKEKEKYILEQTKMASIGEMIENISHQWRQPLNTINVLTSLMIHRLEKNIVDKDELEKQLEIILTQAEYLNDTVNIFQNFTNEKTVYKEVVLQDKIFKALNVVKISLDYNFIDLRTNIIENTPIDVIIPTGVLSQIIINLIVNAQDALLEHKTKEPWIEISLYEKNEYIIISIEDNAGGIPENILEDIFKKHFTTKESTKGRGLGLYLSNNLVQKSLNGTLSAENSSHGAKFTIKFPIQKD